MKRIAYKIVKVFACLLPKGAPEYIYTSLLKPKRLKSIVNILLTVIMPETVKINDSIVALNKRDPVVSGALMLGVYETFEALQIQKKLKPGMVAIDIGANIGYYTAMAAKSVGHSGKVFAFEPDPENFSFLKKTVALNQFQNVECNRIGISNSEGRGQLYLSPENMGDHRIYTSPAGRQSIEIEMMSIDFFMKKNGLQRVDLIKMDIQGAEGLAIQGMRKVIADNPHIKMFTEFWPQGIERTGLSPSSILRTIEEMGFKIFMINKKNGDLEPVQDFNIFANNFRGREYVNLYCEK
ncbi:MAG: FkbM family methyltransferase [bacterium]